jgi:predicted XRE-type DNA-binding protein
MMNPASHTPHFDNPENRYWDDSRHASFPAARRGALARLRKGWTSTGQFRNLERRCRIDTGSRGGLAAWTTMTIQKPEQEGAVTRGTGNVFADLGLPDANERQSKLRLAYTLNQVLDERKLSQADAAVVLGVTARKVSALRHYRLTGFSVEQLMNLLTPIDEDSRS